ncbi:MAG: DUF2703 domain-containing protein [Spirochaetota bacterium]|nr:DUF2703 domain-containing protein [Spirochaetota bacterium]
MKVDFLYFDECPNHAIAYQILLECLKEKNIPETYINKICISSKEEAIKHCFLGSPSIRINGKDIDKNLHNINNDFSIRCRVYKYIEKLSGIPPKDLIIKALNEELK